MRSCNGSTIDAMATRNVHKSHAKFTVDALLNMSLCRSHEPIIRIFHRHYWGPCCRWMLLGPQGRCDRTSRGNACADANTCGCASIAACWLIESPRAWLKTAQHNMDEGEFFARGA